MQRRFVQAILTILTMLLLAGAPAGGVQSAPPAQSVVPDGDFRITIREDFIIEQMTGQFQPFLTSLSVGGMPIEEPAIDLRPDNRIDVSATTVVPFLNTDVTVRPTITVAIFVEENQMQFSVETISLEGVALPGNLITPQIEELQQQVQGRINEGLSDMARLFGVELVDIITTEEVMMIDFDFTLEFFQFDQE